MIDENADNSTAEGPPDRPRPVSLSDLRTGQRGLVEDAERCEDCDLLSALGMTEQCRFRVCKAGAPCIVQIGGTRIGLAADVASRIMVRPNDA